MEYWPPILSNSLWILPNEQYRKFQTMKQIAKKIGFSLVICIAVIGIIEGVLGWTGLAKKFYSHRQSISPIIVRDPVLSWVLKPGIDTIYGDVQVRTGKMGFRGGDPNPQIQSKILCLGDSVTFGWNVSEDESFPAQLEALLISRYPGGLNVINAGIPGHSSHQGRLRIENLIKRFRPEHAILCYGINDRFPSKLTDRECQAGFAKTINLIKKSQIFTLLSAFQPAGSQIRPEPQNIPNAVTHRVTAHQFEENIDWMIKICRNNNVRVILISEYVNNLGCLKDAYHGVLEKIAGKEHIDLVDCVALLNPLDIQIIQKNTESQKQENNLVVKPEIVISKEEKEKRINIELMSLDRYEKDTGIMLDPYHPNASGYRMIAEAMAVFLIDKI